MRARIEMELDDVPGQLVKVLEPISNLGANIQNVVHKRDEKTPLGKVPVTVILELEERNRLDKIIDELKELGARIARVGEERAAARAVLLLVGDIINTDVRDSIERLNSVEGSRVSDLNMAVGESGEESSARIIIEATNQEALQSTISKLNEIADEKHLQVIEPLG